MRWGGSFAPGSERRAVEFGRSWDLRGARLTAYPASHILGAAQLLVELDGERLVYCGDIKRRAPLAGDTTEAVHCDHLIIESTFALPIYHFLDREEARDRILAFAAGCLEEAVTPVFLGYPLGRGQEIVHVLTNGEVPTAVHGAIARYLPVYQKWGYEFPDWSPYQPSLGIAGKALVVTPGFRNYLQASGKKLRIAYVSGWAALANARARTGCEELIPYSDHGDLDELLRIVEDSGATQVDVVHGYTESFAKILESRGIEARAPHSLAGREEAEEA